MTLLDVIRVGAARAPQASAILAEDRTVLDYSRLHATVRDMAAQLNAFGVGRGDCVAIVLPNGPEMAVAFLAVASVATCAPLNPGYTSAEYEFYISDLQVKALIVPVGMRISAVDVAVRLGVSVIRLEVDSVQPAGLFALHGDPSRQCPRPGHAETNDVALMLHTSGTTSRPKLVPLTHANLYCSAHNIARALALSDVDRCLNVMPLFHIHGLVGAVLSSIAAGGSVVTTTGFQSPSFLDWLQTFRPTWYTAVPTMHQAIVLRAGTRKEIPLQHSLRFIRSSSATLPAHVMEDLELTFRVPVIESYGMTEAAHQMASNPLPPGVRKPNSVGTSAGPVIAVMDEKNQFVLSGETGEVVIRGENVTAGYASNPEANANAFTNGWFRTGDQGYLDADGYLFLTGRLKELINRGGEKIAPLEIDAVLMKHAAVQQAVAFAIPDPQLGEEIGAAVVRCTHVSDRELLEHAATLLADFKLPRKIIFVPEIPKGPTGKLQRIGLAKRLGVTMDFSADAVHFVEPETPTEKTLARLWCEVLIVPRIGRRDDFFALGGDSLLARGLDLRVRQQLHKALPMYAVFSERTLERIADYLDSTAEVPTERIASLPDGVPVALSFQQRTIWAHERLTDATGANHRPGAVRIVGEFGIDILQEALGWVVQRHAVLRSRIVESNDGPQMVADALTPIKLEVRSLSLREAEELYRKRAAEPFDLAKGPMLRACLVRLKPDEHVLILNTHHIVQDGWSMGPLLNDLADAFGALLRNPDGQPDSLPIQYGDFAAWQQQQFTIDALQDDLDYWRRSLDGYQRLALISHAIDFNDRGMSLATAVSTDLIDGIHALSIDRGITPFMITFAAFAHVTGRILNTGDVVVSTLTAGRHHPQVQDLIGHFLETVILRLRVENFSTFSGLLDETRKVTLDAFTHDCLPFEVLVKSLKPKMVMGRNPYSDVVFHYRNLPKVKSSTASLSFEEIHMESGLLRAPLFVELLDSGSSLTARFEHDPNALSTAQAQAWLDTWLQTLQIVVANPQTPVADLPTVAPIIYSGLTEPSQGPLTGSDQAV